MVLQVEAYAASMSEADALEFPFVVGLPKREKSKVVRLWEKLAELREVMERNGQIVPASFAAKLLGISHQRILQLAEAGKLERIDVDNHVFVTERSIVELAKAERQAGRPFKVPQSNRELLKLSMAHARDQISPKK